jgi:small subunit ribosomal protein S6
MNQNKRNYKAIFILDTRGNEDSVDQLVEGLTKEIAAINGDVTAVDNLGRKDFARFPKKQFVAGNYVQISFEAPAEAPRKLHERLRLNKTVNRVMIETA